MSCQFEVLLPDGFYKIALLFPILPQVYHEKMAIVLLRVSAKAVLAQIVMLQTKIPCNLTKKSTSLPCKTTKN